MPDRGADRFELRRDAELAAEGFHVDPDRALAQLELVCDRARGVTEGQQFSAERDYAPLPAKLVESIQRKLETVSIGPA